MTEGKGTILVGGKTCEVAHAALIIRNLNKLHGVKNTGSQPTAVLLHEMAGVEFVARASACRGELQFAVATVADCRLKTGSST